MQKIRKFLASDLFNLILFILASIIIVVDQMLGTPVYYGLSIYYGFITFIVLILSDDIVSAFCPALLEISFVIQYKNSFDAYMEYLWGIPFIVFAVLFHIIAYRKSFTSKNIKDLKLFKPILIASIAMLLGGVGIMSFAEYTTKINLSYSILLGPVTLLVYYIFSGLIGEGKNYTEHLDIRISKIFTIVSSYLVFAVLEYYWEHFDEFLEKRTVLQFQWRNNACTLLMLFMPFVFYLSKKVNFAYIIIALLSYGTMVLSGSRGGLLFGTVEIAVLLIYYAVTDIKHRKIYLTVMGIGAGTGIVLIARFSGLLQSTLERFTSYKENFRRLGLVRRSFEDFKANPLFGRGIGYMGNRDLHPSKIGQLCWYHSSLPQVWGSLGIVGIIAYGYQFICRIKFLLNDKNDFKTCVFWSFFALELMSLVNPGIFAPAYLIIITILFVFAEQQKEQI